MAKLPDMEAMAIFAKIVETRGIASAALDLNLSTPTVSKALSRLEEQLGSRLINRTSRRLALTEAGLKLADRAARLLADAEAAQNDMLAQSSTPRGLVRLAAPMSFGTREIAPILPAFLARFPVVTIDLHLSDALVDVVGDGFDLALRIGEPPDSSLLSRRLGPVPGMIVAAPSYLDRRGRPTHPDQLTSHDCFAYAYLRTRDVWHFSNDTGETRDGAPPGASAGEQRRRDFASRDCGAWYRRAARLHRAPGDGRRAAGANPAGLACDPDPAFIFWRRRAGRGLLGCRCLRISWSAACRVYRSSRRTMRGARKSQGQPDPELGCIWQAKCDRQSFCQVIALDKISDGTIQD